jgi:oligo-1,6-glucosidase
MKRAWWKESVVYQIYPRSFCDSNGDGVGDLQGIIRKLDYLKELGIDVIWLCPVYRSPNDDNGYDISDYRDIMPEFGTLADWEELLAGMHRRGINLVMDLVVNHTSDEHPWFIESRSSQDSPYRDYYVWRPPKDGREPNNWVSHFSGSAWQYDEATGEYYLHLFSPKQPDLNWENAAVRREVYDLMCFWLDKGIDGFRMDVINMISKTPGLPDATPVTSDRYQYGGEHFLNGPRLLEFLAEMKAEILSKYDILTVGETPGVTTQHALGLTDEQDGALSMVFQFEHMHLDAAPEAGSSRRTIRKWRLTELKQIMSRWQRDLEGRGWNSIYLGNHDQPRPVSRFGDDGPYRVESAKMLATFVHMLQGTPYVYQGEEIGMTNVAFETIDDYRDIQTLNLYREMVDEKGLSPEELMPIVHAKSRDNARTPMQWDAGPNAGFTTGTPWIKVNPNYTEINVEQSLADPNSVFYYYRELIQLRKANPVIVHGAYDLLLDDDEAIYAFTRTLAHDRLLIILNFTGDTPVFSLPGDLKFSGKALLISNYPVDEAQPLRAMTLRPYEARVYRLT